MPLAAEKPTSQNQPQVLVTTENRGVGSEDSADTNGLAIASLFIGIIWLFGAGSVAAIWLGYRALREIDSSGGEQGGRGIALSPGSSSGWSES